MARRTQQALRVDIEGLERLQALPGFLEEGQQRFLELAATRIAGVLAEAAPGGKTGRIGRATKGRALSATLAEVSIEHPGARALDLGAYIRPKRGKALRFQAAGGMVFSRGAVRLAPRHFTKKGLRKRGAIVRRAYLEAFDQLGER